MKTVVIFTVFHYTGRQVYSDHTLDLGVVVSARLDFGKRVLEIAKSADTLPFFALSSQRPPF